MEQRRVKVAVVGAGTVGLSVATKLLEEAAYLKNIQLSISIIAEHFYDKTTSFGSGGLWEPYQISGNAKQTASISLNQINLNVFLK